MAAITGWTYTRLTNKKMEDSRIIATFTISCGNGTLTYPTGGIPLNYGQFGMAYGNLDVLDVTDQSADGYIYTWNRGTGKLQIFVESGTANHNLVELANTATPQPSLTVEVIGY